jgi:UDPglucose--hexose-1-phosphate uridylyltransferase
MNPPLRCSTLRASMPDLRRDPVTGRWVIVAPERADRPQSILRLPPQPDAGPCPFCPGHEQMTPPELLVHREGGRPNGPGWTLRVIPNKYPALRVEIPMARRGRGFYDEVAGVGAHEVLIETAEHGKTLGELSAVQIREVLGAAQARLMDLARDSRLRYLLLFKNSGAAAGATLHHSHSQLIALPLVPREVQDELDACERHYAAKERCLYCDLIEHELRERERVVVETDGWVALSPWAARTPFELSILPKEHRSQLEAVNGHELLGLSEVLRLVLRKLDRALERPAYNYWVHTLPLRLPPSAAYHFHVELKPTVSLQAGFEWGTGCSINPTPPEEAAAFLRQTEV